MATEPYFIIVPVTVVVNVPPVALVTTIETVSSPEPVAPAKRPVPPEMVYVPLKNSVVGEVHVPVPTAVTKSLSPLAAVTVIA